MFLSIRLTLQLRIWAKKKKKKGGGVEINADD